MADSPSRLLRAGSAASTSRAPPRPLPVWLYLPNLICYVRLGLSAYGLAMVAGTVSRRAAATAAAAAASPLQAVARMASSYMTTTAAAASHPTAAGVGGLLASGTLLGRGLDHLLRTAKDSASTTTTTTTTNGVPSAVDSDLLAALLVFAAAAALDALDGRVARAYDQCSALGVVLDVVADNVTRACLWITAALLDARFALPALGFISCEWLTLLASQVVFRSESGAHWKRQREGDPWLVRQFFAGGFRNPLGVWGVGGLFLAPLWPLLGHSFPALLSPPGATDGLATRIVRGLFEGMGWVMLGGRMLSLGVELYFILGLVRMLGEEGKEGAGAGGRGNGGGPNGGGEVKKGM